MDVIFKFVCDNSHVIIESLLTIVVLFVTLFKKKVKIQDVFSSVLTVLPDLIAEAESKFSSGTDKYSFVFNRCVEILMVATKKKSELVISEYTVLIDAAIEAILATPQKKER